MTALGILRLVATLRAKNVKIRPSLGITIKSDFVFAQPKGHIRSFGDIGSMSGLPESRQS